MPRGGGFPVSGIRVVTVQGDPTTLSIFLTFSGVLALLALLCMLLCLRGFHKRLYKPAVGEVLLRIGPQGNFQQSRGPMLSSPFHKVVRVQTGIWQNSAGYFEVLSKDGLYFLIRAEVTYKVVDAVRFYQNVGCGKASRALSESVEMLLRVALKQTLHKVGSSDMDTALKDDLVTDELHDLMDMDLSTLGLKMVALDVDDIQAIDTLEERLARRELSREPKEL